MKNQTGSVLFLLCRYSLRAPLQIFLFTFILNIEHSAITFWIVFGVSRDCTPSVLVRSLVYCVCFWYEHLALSFYQNNSIPMNSLRATMYLFRIVVVFGSSVC